MENRIKLRRLYFMEANLLTGCRHFPSAGRRQQTYFLRGQFSRKHWDVDGPQPRRGAVSSPWPQARECKAMGPEALKGRGNGVTCPLVTAPF